MVKGQLSFKNGFADILLDKVNIVLLLTVSLICLFPFINIVAVSFSSVDAVLSGKVSFLPVGLNFASYKAVFNNSSMTRSLIFTIFLTVLYTLVTVVLTILCAYPLSKKRLRGRNVLLVFITFTMYFSGGIIPLYLLINELNLINSIWSLILPGAINTFNMIIMKTFFAATPESLEESAIVDGCGNIQILINIVLPVSKPVIAAISLFYAVARWNAFADALMYINNPELSPLQLKITQLISLNMVDQMMNDTFLEDRNLLLPETLKAASIVFATVPILLVYPWLQKYFAKGVMLGSIKG